MAQVKIKIKRLNEDLGLPSYATAGSSGMDLCASIDREIILQPLERILVKTGIAVEISEGYEIQIRPRSGLALKHGITVLNSPGTIDSDYRGEIGVILVNLGRDNFKIEPGMRIAQAVLAKVEKADIEVIADLEETERGQGGFGSTGLSSKATAGEV
jgi:dUTP pyrophosphatase